MGGVSDEERVARALLSRLAEPGDRRIGRLLVRMPAAELVQLVRDGSSTVPGVERYAVRLATADPEADLARVLEVGGHLRLGDPGVRLIEPAATAGYVPVAATAGGDLAVAPLYHLFGSEELSARAPVAAGNVPSPYVALHPREAARRGLAAGATVHVAVGAVRFAAPLALRETLAEGVIGIPAGLPGMGFAFVADSAEVNSGGLS